MWRAKTATSCDAMSLHFNVSVMHAPEHPAIRLDHAGIARMLDRQTSASAHPVQHASLTDVKSVQR